MKRMDDAIDSRQAGGNRSTDAKVNDDHQDKPDRKRSKPGGILGTLSLLKSSKEPASSLSTEEEGHSQDVGSANRVSTIATALRQSQGRKRTGSLRKAAMAKMRERSGSLRKEMKQPTLTTDMSTGSTDNESAFRPLSVCPPSPPASAALLNDTENSTAVLPTPTATASSPAEPYVSTTDEDENVSIYGRSAPSSTSSFHDPAQRATMPFSRRRSHRSEVHISHITEEAVSALDTDDEWDYSETEWWGWVLLIATWIVFVVGMGSCLGVWSWAWDVGETPYAPPDLEDDATLPITGYYPALIVCTAVMSWVWVVVAWVGMKYFRHSKVVGEES